MLANKLMGGAGAEEKLYVDDVFSTYLYTGNGSTQTITNGIDLAGEGGLVWTKNRLHANGHLLYNSASGFNYALATELTSAQVDKGIYGVTPLSNGFVDNAGWGSGREIATWTFRKADKFFDVQTATLGTGNATVSFSGLSTLGMVIVKRTDSTGDWYVWHRSLTAGKLMYLNQTAAEATLGHITVSGTTLTLVDGTLADGNYVCYAFAHDTDTDGMIQCGSFTTDGSGNATVNLGWEPQYVMIKASSETGAWYITDVMRGSSLTRVYTLSANTSGAELDLGQPGIVPSANGFTAIAGLTSSSVTYIYLAIRRPNKPPTSGTQVYNAIARTGTGAAATVTGVGFAPDLITCQRRSATATGARWEDRLRGATQELDSGATSAESAVVQSITAFSMDGFSLGTDADWNASSATFINWSFRRAPGFMDTICFTGTGANKTESHSLGKAPELWLVKGRSGATQWVWGSSLLANTEKIVMPSPAGKVTDATAWNSTYPTASVISLGTAAAVNTSSATYVCYMWATLAGVSKVFSYTGDGSSQTINCGFSAGARFVMIVRTDTTGSFLIWDSVRGIVAANDPHLALDTTAAEVTTDDSIDPDPTGFVVNQLTATNINVNNATYLGLAIA